MNVSETPLDRVVHHQMEAQAQMRRAKAAMDRAVDELVAANRIIDPLAWSVRRSQIEQSA